MSSDRWLENDESPLYVEDLKHALRRIGPVFVQIFGQGETPMTATYLRREDHVLAGAAGGRRACSGRARSRLESRGDREAERDLPRRLGSRTRGAGCPVVLGVVD